MATGNPVPQEVREMISFTSNAHVPDENIMLALKETTSRVEAWQRCSVPRSDSGYQSWQQRNPWRKAHTQNYWVWFRIEVTT